MCRGHCLGDINQEVQTSVERNVSKSVVCERPFRQVRTGILAFEKKRRGFEIPFQDAYKLRPVAERFPEEAGNRDLAFQALQAYTVRGELEYALFVSLGIFCQPDFAGAGDIHGPGEPPLLSSRNQVTGFESQVGARCRYRLALDR